MYKAITHLSRLQTNTFTNPQPGIKHVKQNNIHIHDNSITCPSCLQQTHPVTSLVTHLLMHLTPTVNVSLVFLDLVLVVEFSLATNVTHQFQSIRVVLTSSFVLFQIGCCLEDFSTVFVLALVILHSTLRVENSHMLLVAFLCTEL